MKDQEVVRAELRKLLESAVFANSTRLASFLTFVVDRTLAGNNEQLKETTIGVEVYDRKVGYDPRTEPIVRTEARRLRFKLDEYYQSAGASDALRILLPKGGYAPTFEFRTLLEAASPPIELIPNPNSLGRSRKAMLALAPVIITLILAGAAWWFFKGRRPEPVAPPSFRPLTSYTGTELQPSFSPDGKKFAFVWDGGTGSYDIYAKLVDAGEPMRLTTDPGLDLFPAWSPDGAYVAFLRVTPTAQSLFVVPALGGEEKKIAAVNLPEMSGINDPSLIVDKPGPTWSRDGKYLVISNTSGGGPKILYEFAVDGSGSRPLTSPPRTSAGDFSPAFSPDGHFLAFIRREGIRGNATLYILDRDRRALHSLDFEEKSISDLAWLSQRQIMFSSNRLGSNMLWQVSLAGGPAVPVVAAGRGMAFITYSPGTRSLAFEETSRNENIWRAGLKQGRIYGPSQKFLFSSRKTDGPDISSDGSAVVFVSDRLGTRQIWVAKATGENSVPVTSVRPGVPIGTPRWSPDGRKIAYDTVQGGHSVVAVMNADGRQPHTLAADSWDDMMPSWSHDGKTVYFACKISGSLQLCRQPASGGKTLQITRNGGGESREAWGGRIVFYSKSKGIWQVGVDGGGEAPVPGLENVENGRYWTVANDAIYLLKTTHKPWTVYRYDLATRVISPIFNIESEPNFGSPGLAVAPDLSYILFGQTDRQGSNIVAVDGLFPDRQ